MQHVLAIVGPTASGKTKLSILLARNCSGEIVSADSRQIYRYLDIGTAKPSAEQLGEVPHHFINILDPAADYNAGEYSVDARKTIDSLYKRSRLPVLVGGSGLYVRAVTDGFFDGPGKNPEIREQLEEEVERNGGEALFEKLKKIDPVSASKMDSAKVRRVIRAMEVYYLTGKPISELHTLSRTKPKYSTVQFGLEWDRENLYQRIEERVDRMVEDGLIEEVSGLLEKGYSRSINSLNTVGYKEAIDFIGGKISKQEMINLIKQNTRRYAKRQLTWFRADKRIRWLKIDETSDLRIVAEKIQSEFQDIVTNSPA
jgi:tRNA dimethylallyltransferase